jgi:FixJ family two-component response regulator
VGERQYATRDNLYIHFADVVRGKVIEPSETVFVIDDDFRVREALADFFASRDVDCIAFASAAEYLRFAGPSGPSCLILDLSMPGINGLELQSSIARTDHPPIIFISGHGDVTSSVRAMKAGAIDFLTKPWREEDLLQAVRVAFERDRQWRRNRTEMVELKGKLATLTPREREVLPLVVRGLLNKQAAAQLGISEVTLQIHRSKIMQKMKADSLADLVRMAAKLHIE